MLQFTAILGIWCEEPRLELGPSIGAEHVVGTIDSVLRTGRSFYRIDCADIIPITGCYTDIRSGIPVACHGIR